MKIYTFDNYYTKQYQNETYNKNFYFGIYKGNHIRRPVAFGDSNRDLVNISNKSQNIMTQNMYEEFLEQ